MLLSGNYLCRRKDKGTKKATGRRREATGKSQQSTDFGSVLIVCWGISDGREGFAQTPQVMLCDRRYGVEQRKNTDFPTMEY